MKDLSIKFNITYSRVRKRERRKGVVVYRSKNAQKGTFKAIVGDLKAIGLYEYGKFVLGNVEQKNEWIDKMLETLL